MTTLPYQVQAGLIFATLAGCHSSTAYARDIGESSIVCRGSDDSEQCDVSEGIGGLGNRVMNVEAGGNDLIGNTNTTAILEDGSIASGGTSRHGVSSFPEGVGTPADSIADLTVIDPLADSVAVTVQATGAPDGE